MKYIIVDLEATCWEKRDQSPNEIIEIGALCINDEKENLGEFNTFVRPIVHPILSDFCTQLTSINQEMVDNAPLFPEALQQFQDWMAGFDDEYVLCSWGFYDRYQFIADCKLHQLPTAWVQPHISLKHQYTTIKGFTKNKGMKRALKVENMELEGTHHRGIDDVRNMTKIFLRYFGEWEVGGGK